MTAPQPLKASPLAIGSRMFSSLKVPAYRFYFFGIIAHFGAMSMMIVSNPLLVFRLTNSTALLGTMMLVGAAPMILISIFGGAYADRLKKKYLLITGLIGSGVISLLVGLALTTGALNSDPDTWWILFVTQIVQGAIMGIMMPALQAIIPEIVTREQLMNAIALNTTGMNAANLITPPIAGVLIAKFDFQMVFYVMTGCYVVASLLISRIPAKNNLVAASSNVLDDIKKGFSYVRRDAFILQILIFTLMLVVFSMPYQQFIPVYVDKILHTGAMGSGIINGVVGAGMLIGSLFLTAIPGKKRGLMLLGCGVVAGGALTVFSFSTVLGLTLFFSFFIGLSQSFRNTIGSVLLQTYTEPIYMGRVMAILNMQWGIMSLCAFLVGVLADYVSVQWVLGTLAIMLTIFSGAFFIFSPSIRKVD